LWAAVVIVTVANTTLLGCSVRREGAGERDRQLSEVAPSTEVEAEFRTADATEGMDYDPWERFNEKTFWFNYEMLDRYALKPAGRRYRTQCARAWQMHLITWPCLSGW
jgi:hypothetical protein